MKEITSSELRKYRLDCALGEEQRHVEIGLERFGKAITGRLHFYARSDLSWARTNMGTFPICNGEEIKVDGEPKKYVETKT